MTRQKDETENDQGCLFSFKSSTHSAGELHEKEVKVKIIRISGTQTTAMPRFSQEMLLKGLRDN